MGKPLTKEQLLANGKCCGNGCKNCPYPKKEKLKIALFILAMVVIGYVGITLWEFIIYKQVEEYHRTHRDTIYINEGDLKRSL